MSTIGISGRNLTPRQCDEKRPKCSHCTRHQLPCEYPELATRIFDPTRPKPPRAAVKRQAREDSSNASSPGPIGLPVLELRLLHQWTTETAATMSSAHLPSVREMWTKAVPEMAFEYQPLLHTVLALGAAHRVTLHPEEASTLRPIYHRYIDYAVQHHRPVTSQWDDEINEHVALNAILLSLYTLFLRSETSDTYEPPLLWLSVARGIRTIIKTIYESLLESNSRLMPLLMTHPPSFELSNPPPWLKPDETGAQRQRPFQFILEHEKEEEGMDATIESAYAECVRYLETLYAVTQSGETGFNVRKVLNGFPSRVPHEYFGLVAEKRPRALVILGYLFALSSGSDDTWWFRGTPAKEVRGIESILPHEWKWTMVWPLNLISEAPKQSSPKDVTQESPMSILLSPNV